MHVCTSNLTCRRDSPVTFYKANCTVNEKIACLGKMFLIRNKLRLIFNSFIYIQAIDSFIKMLNAIGQVGINGRLQCY
jgi:hypothetical protein